TDMKRTGWLHPGKDSFFFCYCFVANAVYFLSYTKHYIYYYKEFYIYIKIKSIKNFVILPVDSIKSNNKFHG
ncbi:MAG: hypothetical protein ACE5D6_01760, partial [Candidatus Zixiibacteriota bacterium]